MNMEAPHRPLVYRNVYVVCPRAVLDTWTHEPWDVLLQAAERQEDGLKVLHGRPQRWWEPSRGREGFALDDLAFLAQGQGGEWERKTVLHQQNW